MQLLIAISPLLLGVVLGEDGSQAWLRYAPAAVDCESQQVPSAIVALNSTQISPVYTAGQELQKGLEGILGKHIDVKTSASSNSSAIVVGTVDAYTTAYGTIAGTEEVEDDGFLLSTGADSVVILGRNERGALYGAFEYLSQIARKNVTASGSYVSNPQAPIRWTNEWDNMDGSVERGYGGASNFFRDGYVIDNTTRAGEYARLLASVGINGVIINNVNANATLLSDRNIDGLGRVADAMRPYGVQLGISLNFASPNATLGTFDPLDPRVDAWWTNITDQIYKKVPDMAGYLVKANSEGQPGPITYNRTLADGANMFARAVEPHGGVVMFRAFVYDNHISYSNWTSDRANAQLEFFKPLDGKFDDNVVVQIKYGPIDFQVREPASPLFGALYNTSTGIELQVTPEYLGQNCHSLYLAPLWKEILDFDLRAEGKTSVVKDIVSGKRFKRPLGGYAGVAGAGSNTTWLGNHLSMSNLYAYGKLAWDASLGSEDMLQDWIRLTFGPDQTVLDTITDISMKSWPAYENYTGNLGVETLTDILYTHYGANPKSQDDNGWGMWLRAGNVTVGMDRTIENGTGNAGDYPPEIADIYNNVDKTPDNLLLWFHHVPYTRLLKSGKSVIQHFYDAHYEGAAAAQKFAHQWDTLKGRIDDERFEHHQFRQTYQAGHSLVWRDSITQYFYNLSRIDDQSGRVGVHPYRIEAESMTLDGYKSYNVNPFHAASGFVAIVTTSNTTAGTATTTLPFNSGTYDVAVNYYDLFNGTSSYKLEIGNQTIGTWKGDNEDKLGHEPSRYLDAHTATRITFKGVAVHKGDRVRITGQPDGIEPAPLDYISFLPPGTID